MVVRRSDALLRPALFVGLPGKFLRSGLCFSSLIVLSSVVLSSGTEASLSNALLWKLVWVDCDLPECPQLDSEDLFCNVVKVEIGFFQRCHFVILMNGRPRE